MELFRYVTYKTFNRIFKRKYLSEQYYVEKTKEFYELRLGAMTRKELCIKFLSLLRYVPYIIDEKPKIQRFLSCLPLIFKEWVEYDNPKTLEEAMRKANFYYDQNKNKRESIPPWKNRRPNNFDSKRKQNKFHKKMGNNHKRYQGNNYKGFKP